MKRRWFRLRQSGLVLWVLLFSLLGGCTLNAFEPAGAEAEILPTPSPEFSPDQVVRIQLESLQHNDDSNKGIEAAFNFASPGNKKYTGPLSRFVKMLKAPPYNAMLNHKSVEYDPIEISGDTAIQRVKLTGADGHTIIYIFRLSRQTEAPCKDCWMTDAVTVEPVRELPRGQA
jgi:hypothetical protein